MRLLSGKAGTEERRRGTGLVRTRCFFRSTLATPFSAGLPQARKTTPSVRASTARIAALVKSSQPWPECEAAWWAVTVSEALRRRTPERAQASRLPCLGALKSGYSVVSSL